MAEPAALFAGFYLLLFLIAILDLIVVVWGLWSVLTSDKDTETKILWVLVILFGGFIGVILYYFIGR